MFELIHRRRHSIKDDVLSGLTVALALVPEAIAFAFVAGVEPLVGLYAAFMVGLITATMGGRPGMISGATGALAVVMVALVVTGASGGVSGKEPTSSGWGERGAMAACSTSMAAPFFFSETKLPRHKIGRAHV